MSASAQGAPCRRCSALGWVINYAKIWGPLEICPECDGQKYKGEGNRSIAGICANCNQEVSVVGGPPCLPGYPCHVIPSNFSPSPEVQSE